MDPEYWFDGLAGGDIDDGIEGSSPEYWFEGLTGGEILEEGGPEEEGVGEAAGTSTATAVGVAIAHAVGSAAGTSTALAVGEDAGSGGVVDGAGSAAGTSTVLGVGAAVIGGVGNAAGTSDATAFGEDAAFTNTTGTAAGTSTVIGVGAAIVAGVGLAEGTSTAAAVASDIEANAVGLAEGVATVIGVGAALLATVPGVGTGIYTYTPVDLTNADFNPRRDPPITITDDAPHFTMSYTEDGEEGTEPLLGQHVTCDFGEGVLFKGPIQRVTMKYDEQPDQLNWDVECVDYLWFLNRKRPFGFYEDVSATDVITELMGRYAPEFDLTNVQLALPAVTVEFDGSNDMAACLDSIVSQFDGFWRLDERDLVVGEEEIIENPDDITDDSTTLLKNPPIQITRDASQVRTRVLVKGAGVDSVVQAEVGDDEIDVASIDIFDTGGGRVVVGSQVLTYSSKAERIIDTTEAQELPENGPGGSMTVTTSETAISGMYAYTSIVYGFCTTFMYADGTESKPSEASNLWMQKIAPPVIVINSVPNGRKYKPLFRFIPLGSPNSSGSPCIARRIWYFMPADPSKLILWHSVNDNSTTTVTTWVTGSGQTKTRPQAPPPPGPTGTLDVIDSGETHLSYGTSTIAVSSAAGDFVWGVAAVYEDGTESQLGTAVSATIAMGANRLPQLNTLPTTPILNGVNVNYWKIFSLAGSNPALWGVVNRSGGTEDGGIVWSNMLGSSGGQPRTGVQVTPTSETHYFLTGIPTSGTGSIQRVIPAGAPVRIFEVVEDPTAMADLAVTESGDGVHEYLLDGNYTSHSLAAAAAAAQLALYARPTVDVTYATRDPKTKSGRTVVINLTDPPISETLKIRSVRIDQIHEAQDLVPRYTVSASTVKYTFDDMMKRILDKTT